VDELERADRMLDEADKIGCRSFVSAADVVNGNYKLNLAFVANLFNMHPGFEQHVDGVELDFSALPEETREERSECSLTGSVNNSTFDTTLPTAREIKDSFSLSLL